MSPPWAATFSSTCRLPGIDVERSFRMAVAPFHNLGHHHEVPKRGIHAAADDHLIDLDPRHLPHGHHIAR